jgi:hypothetical protein
VVAAVVRSYKSQYSYKLSVFKEIVDCSVYLHYLGCAKCTPSKGLLRWWYFYFRQVLRETV